MKSRVAAVFVVAALGISSCANSGGQRISPEQAQALGAAISCAFAPLACRPQAPSTRQNPLPEGRPALNYSTKISVFGGEGHTQFLGCLSCDDYASDAIANRYGSFGSKYSYTSIANKNSQYGSHSSPYSACNMYADDPPVVVDDNGQYYGRLTINEYREQIRNPGAIAWLAGVCAE